MAGVRSPAKVGRTPQKATARTQANAIPAKVINACDPNSAEGPSLVEAQRENATITKSATKVVLAASIKPDVFLCMGVMVGLITQPSFQITSQYS